MENKAEANPHLKVDISKEVQESYLDYAMSVIVSRALPDVRDGLKPVHRRILYSMYSSGLLHDRQHKKSARTVGEVISKYHPHGNEAVYDALVRMAQDFSLRIPLIDGHGNFGSIDGDAPAAMRYTEARLSKIASKMLEDLELSTVDFRPNYDGSEEEPVVLPSLIPNLLLNGSGGIAVGMATNIPPHNLAQIIDACCLYIDDSAVSIEDLIQAIEGPDFPTQGSISGISELRKAYLKGRGVITIRGKAEVEGRGARQQSVVVTEIPYAVNKARFVERIAELAKEGKIEGIADLRDESNNTGIRVVLELKRDACPDVIVRQLFKYTQLRVSYGINMLAIDKGVPKVLNLKEVIACFVAFRREVIYRRTSFLLAEARKKGEILAGLLLAVQNIDEVVALIKASKDPATARAELTTRVWNASSLADYSKALSLGLEGDRCRLTDTQAKAILEMRLARLTGLEKQKVENELKEVVEGIAEYSSIIASESKLVGLMKDELLALKKQFPSPRLTKIELGEEAELDEEELIPQEDMVVTFTSTGYIKRVPLAVYKAQRRGGRGKLALQMHSDDLMSDMVVADTHSDLLFFSDLGQVYRMKLHKLPLATLQAKGRPIVNLLLLRPGEKVNNILAVPKGERAKDLCIVFATQKGRVRKNSLSDFGYIPSSGKVAIRLEDDDRLVSVRFCGSDSDIMIGTEQGKCIRFAAEDLRIFKSRSSDGVLGVRLSTKDKVVSSIVLQAGSYSQEERDAYLSIPLNGRDKLRGGQYTLASLQNLLKESVVKGGEI